MRYQMARQGWNQAPQMMIGLEEIKDLCPIVDIEGANVRRCRVSRFLDNKLPSNRVSIPRICAVHTFGMSEVEESWVMRR